ncbi:MAG TPA: class I SAM-dependent methyltransferase [Chloroflexi bacterium]|nr:class I SAM-dependent methyltransferase [Chloroflexota bacterium]HPO59742.1 class I SAM-dependent methyltransferase [Anaerolineaceae bacterium]
MQNEDAVRWNARYADCGRPYDTTGPRELLVEHLDLLPDRGLALDLAMGLGHNGALLQSRGMRVVGVDVSIEAVRRARQMYPGMTAFVADLTSFRFPSGCFDLILNFYYLQRDLLADFARLLKPGGMVVIETLTEVMQAIKPDLPPEYLLQSGELRRLFTGWEILYEREGWIPSRHGGKKAVASLIARLPIGV